MKRTTPPHLTSQQRLALDGLALLAVFAVSSLFAYILLGFLA